MSLLSPTEFLKQATKPQPLTAASHVSIAEAIALMNQHQKDLPSSYRFIMNYNQRQDNLRS